MPKRIYVGCGGNPSPAYQSLVEMAGGFIADPGVSIEDLATFDGGKSASLRDLFHPDFVCAVIVVDSPLALVEGGIAMGLSRPVIFVEGAASAQLGVKGIPVDQAKDLIVNVISELGKD